MMQDLCIRMNSSGGRISGGKLVLPEVEFATNGVDPG
jgi:hypothetical protein